MSMSVSGNGVSLAQGCPNVTHTKVTSCLSLPQHGLQAALGSSGSGMWRNRMESSALPWVQVNPCPSVLPFVLGARQLPLQAGHQAGSWGLRQAMGSPQGVRSKPQDKPLIRRAFSNGDNPFLTCVLL